MMDIDIMIKARGRQEERMQAEAEAILALSSANRVDVVGQHHTCGMRRAGLFSITRLTLYFVSFLCQSESNIASAMGFSGATWNRWSAAEHLMVLAAVAVK